MLPHANVASMSFQQKCKVKREAQTGMCQFSSPTIEYSCGCTALDVLEWEGLTEQTDWWRKQSLQEACVSEDLAYKAKDMTPSIACRMEA